MADHGTKADLVKGQKTPNLELQMIWKPGNAPTVKPRLKLPNGGRWKVAAGVGVIALEYFYDWYDGKEKKTSQPVATPNTVYVGPREKPKSVKVESIPFEGHPLFERYQLWTRLLKNSSGASSKILEDRPAISNGTSASTAQNFQKLMRILLEGASEEQVGQLAESAAQYYSSRWEIIRSGRGAADIFRGYHEDKDVPPDPLSFPLAIKLANAAAGGKAVKISGLPGSGKSSGIITAINLLRENGVYVSLRENDGNILPPGLVLPEALGNANIFRVPSGVISAANYLNLLRRSQIGEGPVLIGVDESTFLDTSNDIDFLKEVAAIPNFRTFFGLLPSSLGKPSRIDMAFKDASSFSPRAAGVEALRLHLAVLLSPPGRPTLELTAQEFEQITDKIGLNPRTLFLHLRVSWSLIKNSRLDNRDLFAQFLIDEANLEVNLFKDYLNAVSAGGKVLLNKRLRRKAQVFEEVLDYLIPTETKSLFEQKIKTTRAFVFSVDAKERQQLAPLVDGGYLTEGTGSDHGKLKVSGEMFRAYLKDRYLR